MPAAVAFRYARALADLAAQPGADPEAVMHDLEAFEQALAAAPHLRTAMQSPAVPPPRKRAVVTHVAKLMALSDLARRFLMVLVDHHRTALIADIREAFESVLDQRLGLVRADVESAREMNEQARRELLDALAQITGKQSRARFSVRPELLGGVVARIGSTVYDGSLRGQLSALQQRLAGAEG